jgi:Excalibur calcium-binding domain
VLTLSPISAKSKSMKQHKSETKSLATYQATRSSRSKDRFNFFPILLLIVATVFIFDKLSNHKARDDQPTATVALPLKPTQQFQCQGKVYCSEMNTYEEAEFYLKNCPGTKMDGDHDGIPCEQQFNQY